MLEDNNIKFDELIRSAMENAQEDAPAKIWLGISASMRRKKLLAAWLKWSGIAVSAAAVVALALVLTRTSNTSPVPAISTPLVTSTTQDLIAAVEEPAIDIIPEPVSKPAVQAISLPEESVVMPAAEEIQTADAGKTVSEPVQTVHPTELFADNSVLADPFEDVYFNSELTGKDSRKVVFDLKGLVSSNDKISQPYYSMAAPSEIGGGTLVQEVGESQYEIPVSFGFGVRLYVADKISIGTGVNYSIFNRHFSGMVNNVEGERIKHSIQYVGIPVNVFFDAFDNGKLKVYGFTGGSVDKAIVNKYHIEKGSDNSYSTSSNAKGVQLSATLGAGIQYQLFKNIGIYLDPAAKYYFDCDQPKSMITEKPFQFNFEAGIRFNL